MRFLFDKYTFSIIKTDVVQINTGALSSEHLLSLFLLLCYDAISLYDIPEILVLIKQLKATGIDTK